MVEKPSVQELARTLLDAYREILTADVSGMAEEYRADYLKLVQRKMSAANALLPFVFSQDGEIADVPSGGLGDPDLEELVEDLRTPTQPEGSTYSPGPSVPSVTDDTKGANGG